MTSHYPSNNGVPCQDCERVCSDSLVHGMHVRHFHTPPDPRNPESGACIWCHIAWPGTRSRAEQHQRDCPRWNDHIKDGWEWSALLQRVVRKTQVTQPHNFVDSFRQEAIEQAIRHGRDLPHIQTHAQQGQSQVPNPDVDPDSPLEPDLFPGSSQRSLGRVQIPLSRRQALRYDDL